MSIKGKIKVIKRSEIESQQDQKETKPKKRDAVRRATENVSSWVADLQSRKREEAKAAIDSLFRTQPRTSEF